MASTETSVVRDNRRRDTSRGQSIRSPIIAPKKYRSFSTCSSDYLGAIRSSIPPRTRLRPRSKSGCWTCRTRKVKCDEGRPACKQCTRLGHHCDYNPRLAFRDDTPRVLERMQDIIITGSVWDTNSPTLPKTSAESTVIDDSPSFASLTTDEDREKRAERSNPGTYHVVINQDSFHHLPEYCREREQSSPLRRSSIATSTASSIIREAVLNGITVSDPNVVILPRFEDVPRRERYCLKDRLSPTSLSTENPSIKGERRDGEHNEEEGEEQSKAALGKKLASTSNPKYLIQFRHVIWRQLASTELDQVEGSSINVLEAAANEFPPLYHAMVAVGALSLATHDSSERLDALQHYQQALPALQSSLRSSEDLCSDGAFLTHFLLLLYEILAAEAGYCNVWSQQLSTLVRITLLRHELFGDERFPFVLWWVCNLDLNALFSVAGNGKFVGSVFGNDVIAFSSLYPPVADGSSPVVASEPDYPPTFLRLNYEVTIVALRLALLAFEFRRDTTFDSIDIIQRCEVIQIRQRRILELQETLRQLWFTPEATAIISSDKALQYPSKKLYEHATILSRACIIYSHTSMWPGQRMEMSQEYDTEIAVASNQILHIARKVLAEGKLDCRYLVFPTFIAGFASTDRAQRRHALDLIRQMEKNNIGQNTAITRKTLAAVYERQNERLIETGQFLDVDWMEVMVEEELGVVDFDF